MKRLALLTVAAIALASGAATAADIRAPVKAPAVAPAAPCCGEWSGFYLGIHGGWGWKRNDFQEVISVVPLVTLGGIDSRGWVFGGQAGYNWQYGSWVVGLEVDFSATRIRGESTPVVRTFAGGITITDTEGDDVKWLGTARTRVGFTPFTPNVLIYGTGGLAWERVNRIDTTLLQVPGTTQLATTTDPRDWFGWVAGVGAEVKLFGNWVGRVEYLHYDFGTVEASTTVVTTPPTPGGTFSDTAGRQTIDVIRGGLSYKFWCDCGGVRAAY